MTAPESKYGKCKTCGTDMPTKADGDAHMSATSNTVGGSQSHTIFVLNPPREDMVRRDIHMLVSEAVDYLINDLIDKVEREEYTEADIRDGLSGYSDFQDAWDDRDGES